MFLAIKIIITILIQREENNLKNNWDRCMGAWARVGWHVNEASVPPPSTCIYTRISTPVGGGPDGTVKSMYST